MAWLRGKGRTHGKEESPPAVPPGPNDRPPEVLPDARLVGTTQDREAYKQIRRADSRLKRLERQEARARKREERRLRAIDKRLARIEGSMEMRPVTLLVTLSVLNGAAALFVLLYLWWPDLPLYDPFFLPDTAHWEVVAYCFVVAAISTVYLLVSNPSPRHIERAQRALGVYMAVGIIGTFVGLLMAQVLADMELMDIDWELWLWVALIAATGSAVAMTVIYAAGHRRGSRAFLRGPYHQAMGVVTAVLAVSLVFLPFLYLPYKGWMNEVGVSVYYVSWLLVAFPLPALAASVLVRHRSEELAGYYAMA
jgi:hypothetical protein